MSETPNEIEQKLIEFATKTAETIQTQAGQIQALSHVTLIAVASISQQNASFKSDFVDRIRHVHAQLTDRPIDRFTAEYLGELLKFIENPYSYSANAAVDEKPNWFKGIISGGKKNMDNSQEPPHNE